MTIGQAGRTFELGSKYRKGMQEVFARRRALGGGGSSGTWNREVQSKAKRIPQTTGCAATHHAPTRRTNVGKERTVRYRHMSAPRNDPCKCMPGTHINERQNVVPAPRMRRWTRQTGGLT